ncbi:MAG: PAS domain S-box protein [Cyclobacteriaceae bacterium]|nr:PAS domain S-box protein [Cyclobacteriaceae bacterium]
MRGGITYFLILLSLYLPNEIRGQSSGFKNTIIDSLKTRLPHTTDSVRVDLLNDIAYNYYYYKLDSTDDYALQAIELANSLGYKKGLAEGQRMMGISAKALNNHAEAIKWLTKGLETARAIQYYQGIADILNSLGILYDYIDDHDQAVMYYKDGVKYQQLAGNRTREGIVYTNAGVSYIHKNDPDTARYYFLKALSILDSAAADPVWQAMVYSQYGGLLVMTGHFDSALYYSKKAEFLSEKYGQTFHLRKARQNLAEIAMEKKQFSQAVEYGRTALDLSRKIGFLPYIIEALNLNYRLAKSGNQTEKALMFLEQSTILQDSLLHDKAKSQAGLYAFRYALEMKEKENALLRQETEAERAINLAKSAVIERQRIIVAFITAILLFMSLLAFVFFRLRSKERHSNRKLVESNEALESQKKEITSTLKMVEQLNAQLQAQNTALNHSAIVSITDLQGHIVSVNDNFCRTTGYSRDELLGKNIRIVNSGEHSHETFAQLWEIISRGDTWRGELKNKKKDGTYYWCDAAIAPIFDDNDKPKLFFALQFDISQRKKYLEELSLKSSELEDLNNLKDKLLSIVSHDFRSPLNTLKGSLSLLVRGALSADEFKMLTRDLLEKLDHTYNLLENLLHWAKSQMEGMKVYPRDIDIREIAEDCIELLAPIAEKKLVNLHNNVVVGSTAFADNEMIKLVIRNLVSNAIKFSNASGAVNLDSKIQDGQLIISVKDVGTGISNANQEKLFRTESVTTSGTSNERGIGLGLLLCKDFVERNGGTIWFESEYMKGSTFYFTIPTAKNQPV